MKNKFINIYTLLSLIIGFFLCFIIIYLSGELSLTSDNIINLISILINLIIAGFIVLFLQKKYSDDREVKNYIISELQDIQSEYKKFSNCMLTNKNSGSYVVAWFKVINVKLGHIKYFMKNELEIDDNRLNVLFRKYRTLITNSDSFNETFSDNNIVLNQQIKNKILESNKEFNHNLLDLIIQIHKK